MAVLFTFNLQTKFKMSSFIRSKDMAWSQKCTNGSRDLDNAHLWDSQSSQGYYFTRPSTVRNLKSLALDVPEIFHGIVKCVTWPWPRPFQGWLVVSRLRLATINVQTKFQVSNHIHYEDMKSSAKCTNWGNFGQFGVNQGHRQCHHSIERIRYSTLIETMRLSWTVFEL